MRNRYYDPQLGRFVTVDPMGYVDGPNPYGFLMNDPVNQRDPLGLEAIAQDAATGESRVFTNGQEYYAYLMEQNKNDRSMTAEVATQMVIAADMGADINAGTLNMLAKGVDTSVRQQLKYGAKVYAATAAGALTGGLGEIFLGGGLLASTASGVGAGVTGQFVSDKIEGENSSLSQYFWAGSLGALGGAMAGLRAPEAGLPSGIFNPESPAPPLANAEVSGDSLSSLKEWWNRGSESDAAWRDLSLKEKYYYEVGQKTLPKGEFEKYQDMDPVQRGSMLIEEKGHLGALLPNGAGWRLGAGQTLQTGPTPLVRWLTPRAVCAGAAAGATYYGLLEIFGDSGD
jgi:hypothetical protein